MKELVRLRTRPSRDGRRFTYLLDYVDENGKRRRTSLGHADKRKAERQRIQKERELRMGVVDPTSMCLSELLQNNLDRSRGQVRRSTLRERDTAMRHLIQAVGDIDFMNVTQMHGERFIQSVLDIGNTPATVNKKVAGVKRVFQLAVERGQLEENPFRYLRKVRVPHQKIRIYDEGECNRLIRAARQRTRAGGLDWELLFIFALCTGMRRGEILNTTWKDIDFDAPAVHVSPTNDTAHTWIWNIKDAERRRIPLIDQVVQLLVEHQVSQPSGYPYVFVPTGRYDRIQKARGLGQWTEEQGKCPINNFTRQFQVILRQAAIEEGEFHDFRRTRLTWWFREGLSEFDVMTLAGHSDFNTTRRFYLAVREDLLERTRRATASSMPLNFGARLARAPSKDAKVKKPSSLSA